MAVSGVPHQHNYTTRLNSLLQRARAIKQSTSIDPPLQTSALVDDNEPLLDPIQGDKEVHNFAIEAAAKSILYANLSSTRIKDPSYVTVWNLFDILQYCGDRDLCPQQLVLLLIEELFDSLSLAGCRVAFSFLESRREALTATMSQNKSLVILRLCNELLRRLSRAEDPVFCGRVYIFLFQSFPLGDKSSVNLRGNFHIENVTTFEDYLKTSTLADDQMVIDVTGPKDASQREQTEEIDGKPLESDKVVKDEAPTMDIDTLYPVFWSLQHSFSNPPRLFDEENFKQFQKSLEATLAKFRVVPKVIQAGDSAQRTASQTRSDDSHSEFASASNPKYLTSRDLFKLELSDLAFQRHILVQALILIDFLLTLTDKSKNKPYYQNAQKAMQYNFTLSEEDTEWALGIKNSIANYLQDGPDGKFYYRMVDTVLSRDKNWVRWKMENCQPFTRDRVPAKHFLESKSGAQRAVTSKKAPKASSIPSTLQFLSNTEPERGLSQLRDRERFTRPSPQTYAKQVQMIDLDIEMAQSGEEKRELEEKRVAQTWRGLRLASKDQLSSFDRLEHGRGLKGLFQPAPSSVEATGDDNLPNAPDDRDPLPQEAHPSVEEQRAD